MVDCMTKQLNKKQWLDHALKTLARQGINAVRVERLAKDLKVTKGSFYWHFKNRDALLSAMLEAWQAYATNNIIETVEQAGGDARQRLRNLFITVLESDNRLDREVRNWADNDDTVKAALTKIDARRIRYVESLFIEMGFTPLESLARARLIYHALIGQFTMDIPGKKPGRHSSQFEAVFTMLTRN